jgi:predicted glutamine amidotransferase
MCGIIILADTNKSKGWKNRSQWFHDALFVDTLRGNDSTGILAVPHSTLNDIVVHKKAIPAYDFLQMDAPQRILDNSDKYRYIVGHNRAATKGTVTNRNAHPFSSGPIHLVHNGTLRSMAGLKGTTSVDSERICQSIAEDGDIATLEALEGSYTLVWYDDHAGTLNMARNSERPLYLSWNKDGSTMLGASEAWMIDALISKAYLNDFSKAKALTAGELWSFDDACNDFRNYSVEKFKVKTTKAVNYVSNNPKKESSKSSNKESLPPKSSTSILLDLGYIIGDTISFTPVSHVPYERNKEKGTVEGLVYGKKVGEVYGVAAYGFDTDKYDQDSYMCGEVMGAYELNGWPIVQVKDAVILDSSEVVEDALDDTPFNDKEELGDIEYTDLCIGPNGIFIKKELFMEMVSDGCVMCTAPVRPEEDVGIIWTSDHRPYCPECVARFKDDNEALPGCVN